MSVSVCVWQYVAKVLQIWEASGIEWLCRCQSLPSTPREHVTSFRLRIINLASTCTSGHLRSTITTERSDSRPRNEARKKTKDKQNNIKKKTELQTNFLTERHNFQHPSSQTASEAGHMSSKATPQEGNDAEPAIFSYVLTPWSYIHEGNAWKIREVNDFGC
jgi:hypothetical protein